MSKKKINIQFVSGSRADYGIMSGLVDKLKKNKFIHFNILSIGSHNLKEYGNTFKDININKKKLDIINIQFSTKRPEDISIFSSKLISKLTENFIKRKPNLILLLGDRYEVFVTSYVATLFKIPIAHFCGGDETIGSYDNSFRYAISHLANYHFTTNTKSKNKIIKLINSKKNVYNFGHISLNNITKKKILSKKEIEKNFKLKFGKRSILITFHPLTKEKNKTKKYFQNLLSVLTNLRKTTLIFTSSNADHEGRIIKKMINNFVMRKNNAYYVNSFGQKYFFSVMHYVNGIVGNSSSGILEAPSFKKAVVNIGNRQAGRIFAKNIIQSSYKTKDLNISINKIFDKRFNKKIMKVKNPYYKVRSLEKTYKEILKIKNYLY